MPLNYFNLFFVCKLSAHVRLTIYSRTNLCKRHRNERPTLPGHQFGDQLRQHPNDEPVGSLRFLCWKKYLPRLLLNVNFICYLKYVRELFSLKEVWVVNQIPFSAQVTFSSTRTKNGRIFNVMAGARSRCMHASTRSDISVT